MRRPRTTFFRTTSRGLFAALLLSLIFTSTSLCAQVNGVGQHPALGWGSWTQQLLYGSGWLNEAHIKAQSDALKASGLQDHGYVFINIDSGWQSGFDQYGRPMVSTSLFPSGFAALVQYIHNNGQKAGIYWIPGIQYPAYTANGNVYGTSYSIDSIVNTSAPGNAFSYTETCCNYWHKKIDFTKPGAQEYVNSVVNLFASWGFDAIKLDGVTPGSDINNLVVDNRAEVQAWSTAIAQSGRPMELTVSWALDHNYLSTWQTYANARRIEDDVNCYCSTATQWFAIARLFPDLEKWQHDASPTVGWNDLDSLIVGNGANDGLSQDERRSTMTLWAIANSPMIVGDDLTQLDAFGKQLLTNDAVIAVNQSGSPATEVAGGTNPVWASSALQDGSFNVALFNLTGNTAATTVNLSSLGITGTADVYDLWAGQDLGTFTGSYSATLNPHGSALVRITPNAPMQVPDAPSSPSAQVSNGQVSISWSASSGATNYNVYRGTASGAETKIASGITSTSYADTNVTNGMQYFYEITAVNSAGESSKSTEVSATAQVTAPAAPTGFAASAGNAKVTLTWTATIGAATYNVYRGTSSGAENALTNGVTGTAYTDNTAANGTTYYYKVTAVNSAGEGAQSAEVSATPTTGFTASTSTTSLSTSGSGDATSTITITPNYDTRTLTFSCSNLPAGYGCAFNPSSVALSGLTTPQNVTLTVSNHVASLRTGGRPWTMGGFLIAALFPVGLIVPMFLPQELRKRRNALIGLVALMAILGLASCGGGSSTAAPPSQTSKSYNFQVNVQSEGSTVQTLNYTLTVH